MVYNSFKERGLKRVVSKKRILVGFSGGYASAVAAFLLSKQNYDVMGIYLRLNLRDSVQEDKAKQLADKFDIPLKVYDLSKEEFSGLDYFQEAKFVHESPDLEYHNNQFIIKSLEKIADDLGIEFIGTGHILKKNYLLKEKEFAIYSTPNWENMQTHLVVGVNLDRLITPLGDIPHTDISKICLELGIDYKYFIRKPTEKVTIHDEAVTKGEGIYNIILKNTKYFKPNYVPMDCFFYLNKTHQVVRGISYFKPFSQAFLETSLDLNLLEGEEVFVFENSSANNKRLIGFGLVLKTKLSEPEELKEKSLKAKNSYEYF